MNSIKSIILATFVLMGTSLKASDVEILFSKTDIKEARKRASEEGKLLFVDFYADWCTPCKWMDQTTFQDSEIIKTLNTDYVTVKVDIDDMNGFELKNSFNVKYLPTMLIFNSQGQMVQRIEETMSPRILSNILDKHNLPQNKVIIKHDLNSSPSEIGLDVTKVQDPIMLSREEYKRYFEQAQTDNVYKVQMGVFQKYESANELVNKLRKIFLEDITVVHEYRDNSPYFKVRMGQFASYEEAESFRKILKSQYNMDGIVQ
ncbi:MAG: thioredoxin family protein [Saprospiraceae bacterium]